MLDLERQFLDQGKSDVEGIFYPLNYFKVSKLREVIGTEAIVLSCCIFQYGFWLFLCDIVYFSFIERFFDVSVLSLFLSPSPCFDELIHPIKEQLNNALAVLGIRKCDKQVVLFYWRLKVLENNKLGLNFELHLLAVLTSTKICFWRLYQRF